MDLSLKEIQNLIVNYSITLLVFFFTSLALSYSVSLFISDKYKSEAILVSQISDVNSSYNLPTNIGNLAGFDLFSATGNDKSLEAIELMRSLNFFEKLSKNHNLFFSLMAVDGWDKKNNILRVNDEIYDDVKEQWVSKLSTSKDGKPSLQTAHREFLERFSASKQNDTGFVQISFIHYSPFESERFVNAIIQEINETSRQDEIDRGKNSLVFLRNELENSKYIEVKNAINQLIERQLERIMIANSSEYFLFETLSPPYAPEEKDSPNRPLFTLAGVILGITLFFLYLLIVRPKKINFI